MCNNTDLAGRNVIDNIKRHDCECEKDEYGVDIGNILQHEFGAYEVVCISNGSVECRMKECTGEETISVLLQRLNNV